MTAENKVLVMAGAREAHGLVTALLARERQVIASLPEPERMFGLLPVATRTGPFSGDDAMVDWMVPHRLRAVLDASHAFDDHVCAMTQRAASRLGVPYLRVIRPPWQATPKDRWSSVPSIFAASDRLPAEARVFTNTGWGTLSQFEHFRGEVLYVRQTTPEPRHAPFPFVRFVEGRPPFSQFQEEALFRRLAISHVVARNVGGAASMAKLLAARAMALPVLMVARPARAETEHHVHKVAEALAWEAGL